SGFAILGLTPQAILCRPSGAFGTDSNRRWSAPQANVFNEVRTMDKDFKRLTDFLIGMGVEQVPHTHKSYLAHLIAVFRSLESQGYPEDVCRAGMFHSIYGTEKFQGFTLPLERRDEVRGLIGDRAERLAYMNCSMDRASLDRA